MVRPAAIAGRRLNKFPGLVAKPRHSAKSILEYTGAFTQEAIWQAFP
jgi:hypothetical protein